MDSLTKLRVTLTIGALVGLVPVTLLFILAALYFSLAVLTMIPQYPLLFFFILGPYCVSLFCICTGWKIYAISMCLSPEIRNRRALIAGLIVGFIWGLAWVKSGLLPPDFWYVFLLPSITATAMLAVTFSRIASAQKRARDTR